MSPRSGGRWRIFSKLGAGYSASRGGVGEVLTLAYACVPVLGARNAGLEFVVAARASVKGDTLFKAAQLQVKAAVDAAVAWVAAWESPCLPPCFPSWVVVNGGVC